MERCRALAACAGPTIGLLVCLAGVALEARASEDPGLLLELDRARHEVITRDERTGEPGPRIRVVLGSPANETPAGDYPVGRVILNPAWQPGDDAIEAGAKALPPSTKGPMGVAKIPFAEEGSIALHGAGDELLLGKSVSGGCVRARDGDLLRVIAWLHERGTLYPPRISDAGEVHRAFRRPVRILVR